MQKKFIKWTLFSAFLVFFLFEFFSCVFVMSKKKRKKSEVSMHNFQILLIKVNGTPLKKPSSMCPALDCIFWAEREYLRRLHQGLRWDFFHSEKGTNFYISGEFALSLPGFVLYALCSHFPLWKYEMLCLYFHESYCFWGRSNWSPMFFKV